MQYNHDSSANGDGAAPAAPVPPQHDALQVLAATASNDRLREQYHDDRSTKSSSPASNNINKTGQPASGTASNMSTKPNSSNRGDNNAANNSEDDDSGSRVSSGSSASDGVSKRTGLRKGKWTVEEEEYATRFIHYFSSGLLTLPEGKTLRASLAEKLKCDPMRITKKYAGASCLGNKISKLCDGNRPRFSAHDIEMAKMEIARLERRFHLRLAQGAGVPLPPERTAEQTHRHVQHHYPGSVETLHRHQQNHQHAVGGLSSSQHSVAVGAAQGIHNAHQQQPHQLNASSSFTHSGTPSVPLVHQTANATMNPTAAPAKQTATTMAPSVASYLATLASNAQLAAAASLAPHASNPSMMAGAPAPVAHQQSVHKAATTAPPPPAPVTVPQQQQQHQQHINKPATQHQAPQPAPAPNSMATAAQAQAQSTAALQAMGWPATMLNMAQVGVPGSVATAPSPAATTATPNNDQLVQTLLLQITSQLQALAILSPSTLRLIQLQILTATLPAGPPAASSSSTNSQQAALHFPGVGAGAPAAPQAQAAQLPGAAGAGADTTSALLANFQLAASGQLTARTGTFPPAAAASAVPTTNPGLTKLQQNFLAQQQATSPGAVAAVLSQYGLNAYGGVAAAVATSPSPGQPVAPARHATAQVMQQQHAVQANQVSVHAGRKRASPAQHESIKSPPAETAPPAAVQRPSQAPVAAAPAVNNGHNIAEFLNKLRQGHAEALEQARREAEAVAICHRRGSKDMVSISGVSEGESSSAFTANKGPMMTSRSSSILTNSTSVADQTPLVAGPGPMPAAKKQRKTPGVQQDAAANTNGIVPLLPFEHATTVSSGSGCTTNDGSTSSSIENLLASDETRNDGSASSNSLSEEEEADVEDTEPSERESSASASSSGGVRSHRSSVPLRKRFRSSDTLPHASIGGITKRNLADHNFRMAEEMKNHTLPNQQQQQQQHGK